MSEEVKGRNPRAGTPVGLVPPWALAMAIGLIAAAVTWAQTETPLASYEPSETDLVVTANHPADPGLTVTIVQGGVGGVPAATDGDYVLKVDFVGEADGKVEFTHDWSTSTYDLLGEDELLADVYIATASAIPGLMGIWSAGWNPPDAWQQATGIPATVGVWTTISFDVSARSQTGLDQIWAFIFQNMPGQGGTAYVDNLRFRRPFERPGPTGLTAVGYETRIDLEWNPVTDPGLQGYNIYRAESPQGEYSKLNGPLHTETSYSDEIGEGGWTYFYYVTAVVDGQESDPSEVASASTGISDEVLMDTVQQMTFNYFWDYGHPVSGMARDSLTGWGDTCASGGTGMGLMTIAVGVERGFVTRSEGADRVLLILTFLDETVSRYHGAWAHWINGTTGATIPFTTQDDGGDLVETAYVVQGLLTVRQYFDDPADPVETEIRTRATEMWEEVEWDWYRRFPGGDVLYWHWSPNYDWAMNMPITGYNEAMIVYLLAIASPTHPMPPSSYHYGWAGSGGYANGNTYYGYKQWVGPPYGGPLFFTHYSFLGFDPRAKRDAYCNYFENSRNTSLIHQAYSIDNPSGYAGYSASIWGLTASVNPWGYGAHSPTSDNGTIAPTAALSAMPFTPQESKAALRNMIYRYSNDLWGPYGFYDAFNLEENWFANTCLAIDQGPIIIMIENHRTQLCWNMFMANPEIRPMLQSIGFSFGNADMDGDGDVDSDDYTLFAQCISGPDITARPPACSDTQFLDADLDGDRDVDLGDFSAYQQVSNGP